MFQLTTTKQKQLKYGFYNKSSRKDEPLTSWTLLQHIYPHFWAWLLNTIAITPKSEDKYVVKVFHWSEVHLSEMACYKIHTLDTYFIIGWKSCNRQKFLLNCPFGSRSLVRNVFSFKLINIPDSSVFTTPNYFSCRIHLELSSNKMLKRHWRQHDSLPIMIIQLFLLAPNDI